MAVVTGTVKALEIDRRPRSITLKNFQCFDEIGCTLEKLSSFNVLIGPNNSGKSKLIQALQRLNAPYRNNQREPTLIHRTSESFEIEFKIDASEYDRIYFEELKGKGYQNYFRIMMVSDSNGKPCENARILAFENKSNSEEKLFFKDSLSKENGTPKDNPLNYGIGFYIAAERDVRPETKNERIYIEPNGEGTTNLIRTFLLVQGWPNWVVEERILDGLNQILKPNFEFTNIRCQEIEPLQNNQYEIFLNTSSGHQVALSQSGSGLKTVIHFLSNLYLSWGKNIDRLVDFKIRQGLYLFEEIENALHPRMLRNFLEYIEHLFVDDAMCVFASHSPVLVDYFSGKTNASIYDINQTDGVTRARRISAFNDHIRLLDAIGVKASDALQSNFVVWVEGPTDRMYLNFLIQKLQPDLEEGRDYSIMFYGGKLLSHLSLDSQEDSLISLLKINPKCAILIDSDKKSKDDDMNSTKNRILFEAADTVSCWSWVTHGREIENYISTDFLKANFDVNVKKLKLFDKIFEEINGKTPASGDEENKISSKIELSAFVTTNANIDDFIPQAIEKTKELIAKIIEANS